MISPVGPIALVRAALGLQPSELLVLEPVLPRSRNPVWRTPGHFYLKLQGGPFPSETVREEAEVLALLAGRLPYVPTVLATGTCPETGLPYLLTQALPGHPVTARPDVACEPLFDELVGWLDSLQRVAGLRELLSHRLPRLVDRYRPDFDPLTSALERSAQLAGNPGQEAAREYHSLLAELVQRRPARPTPEVVHGSLAPANILRDGHHLTGVLDFEGTRLGSAMYDVASLAADLLETHGLTVVRAWLRRCGEHYGPERIQFEARPFLLDMLMLRARCEDGKSAAPLSRLADLP